MEEFLKRNIEHISKWYKSKPYTFTFILILSCIAFVLSMPALLTGTWLNKISFDNTGQIGDTIGGITAPFISLISGLLVYYSFRAQIEANRLLSEQYMADKTTREIDEMCNDIDNQIISIFNLNKLCLHHEIDVKLKIIAEQLEYQLDAPLDLYSETASYSKELKNNMLTYLQQ